MSDAPSNSSPQEADASFNDDELQDIMSEIESLEQEFGESAEPSAQPVALEQIDHEDIERELQELEDSIEEEMGDFSEPEEATVHPLAPHSSPSPASSSSPSPSPCVELKASGAMNMSFNVPVGDQQACVQWNGEVLSITLNGVCIELNSDNCQVDLPGGASFIVPVMKSSKAQAA